MDSYSLIDASEPLPRCLTCSYILIGLPSDRCPECGYTIDWRAVELWARDPGLPIDRRTGFGRLTAGLRTWLMVLFQPRKFARRLSERSSWRAATIFAVVCIAIGFGGHVLFGFEQLRGRELAGWAIAVWFHIECQSLLFFFAGLRKGALLRQWSAWRKVSLYTTAFVVLDWAAGPPIITNCLAGANFPWLLSYETWRPSAWWPITNAKALELARGVAYYWWLAVLMIVLWLRLRRKWCLLIVLALMPAVTMASCRVAFWATDMIW